jgi:hypothetical protein
MIKFISGHLDITPKEFEKHYVGKIFSSVVNGDHFVIGDAPGTDRMAIDYLWSLRSASGLKVTIFHMFDSPRYNPGFPTKGGYESDTDRDEAMTLASDEDIAWVRPGKENSGTAKNLLRRKS